MGYSYRLANDRYFKDIFSNNNDKKVTQKICEDCKIMDALREILRRSALTVSSSVFVACIKKELCT